MSTRSLLSTKSLLLVMAVAGLAPPSAWADRRDDLYNQAVKAGSAGQVEEAARLFCDVAKLDAGYKDARQMCTLMTEEAGRERKRNDDRFNEGVAAFNEGRWDDAEQKFRNVRGGNRVDEARQYLSRIPAAKAEKSNTETENAKFEQAIQAYQRNDFAAAKSALAQVSGRRAREAQTLLANIAKYEQAMSAGDTAAAANPRQAIASYSDAADIKGDGPGDPRGKIARLQSQLAAASSAAPAAAPAGPAASNPPTAVAAVKESRPSLDVSKLMREAQAAENRGQTGLASGKYLAVLAADPGNAAARHALTALSTQTRGRQAAGSEADVMLAKAIREFYIGSYEEAEVHIKDYLAANGSKVGLSNFYLAAIRLTRFYLSGQTGDRRLLTQANEAFMAAKITAGFRPPDEKVISPKILKAYNDASQ
jgi:hypothetical protein